jgi:hypothetical protein
MRLCLEVQNLVVFIDEISFYVNAGWMPEPLEYISRAGNHRGVALVYTTQRPQIVAMDLRDKTNVFKVFRLEGDDAIKALASRIPKEYLVQVPRLPNRAFVHRSADFVCRIVKN